MPRRRARSAVAPIPLGSLTQRSATTGEVSCPECGDTRVTQIAMSLTDGTPVRFTSCRACEYRWWEHQDRTQARQLEVDEVLARTRRDR